MATLTPRLMQRVKRIALMLCKGCPQHIDDAIQEGQHRILEMSTMSKQGTANTEAYFCQGAFYEICHYLSKEQLYEDRKQMVLDYILHRKED